MQPTTVVISFMVRDVSPTHNSKGEQTALYPELSLYSLSAPRSAHFTQKPLSTPQPLITVLMAVLVKYFEDSV